ncbi:hypothetical protein MY1884_002185 [Beauveria asiatica]
MLAVRAKYHWAYRRAYRDSIDIEDTRNRPSS